MTTKVIDIDQPISLYDVLANLNDDTDLLLFQGDSPVAKVTALGTLRRPDDLKPRVLGLDVGKFWVSEDFDDELPDAFWLGDEA